MNYEPMQKIKNGDMDSDTRKAFGQFKKNLEKKQNPMRKIVVHAVKAAVIPMLIMLAKIMAIVLLVSLVVSLFSSILNLSAGAKNAGEDSSYNENLQDATTITNLSTYLLQFSHAGEAAQSSDGKYYKLYSDGKWPTIGKADLQWKSFEEKFNCEGNVLEGDEEKTVSSVKEYVNGFLTSGSTAEYTVDEIDALNIYIEKELVDNIGEQAKEDAYKDVERQTSGLSLSKQQLYALTAIRYNFGHLPERNGYDFKSVYESGAGLYEINSGEHNRFIWDNWWCYLGGGYPGHIPARDAAFETYVKGVYDFSKSDAGEVFSRNYYIYYTQEQLNMFSEYAPVKPITRDINDEENEIGIFTYNENAGTSQYSGDILAGCELVMQDLLKNDVVYSTSNLHWNNIKASSDFSTGVGCCCATYVSVVLYKTGILTEEYINQYNYNWTGPLTSGKGGVNDMLKNAGWTQVDYEDAAPGDVCVWYASPGYEYRDGEGGGHTYIYAGGDEIWDQNSGCKKANGSGGATGGTLKEWSFYYNWAMDYKARNGSNSMCIYIWRAPYSNTETSQNNSGNTTQNSNTGTSQNSGSTIQSSNAKPSQNSGKILAGCESVMYDLLEHNVKYNRYNLCYSNIKESSDFSKYSCVCATYVSVVLYKTGLLPEEHINKYAYNSTNVDWGLGGMLRNAEGWILVDVNEAMPGDVCVYGDPNDANGEGHAFIYAGGNAIWDQNCGCAREDGTPPTKGPTNRWTEFKNYCANNGIKLYVFRAP